MPRDPVSPAEQRLADALRAQWLDDAPIFTCANAVEVVLGTLEEHSSDTVRWLVDRLGTATVVGALADAVTPGGLVAAMVGEGVLEQGTILSRMSNVTGVDGEVVRFSGLGPFYRLRDPASGWAAAPGEVDRG